MLMFYKIYIYSQYILRYNDAKLCAEAFLIQIHRGWKDNLMI
jgi:hypothetical protein